MLSTYRGLSYLWMLRMLTTLLMAASLEALSHEI
jgi:hypothetical protein